jgi:hypothetical protein
MILIIAFFLLFCQQPIDWKYAYGHIPAGQKNVPLNPDGSLHNCRTEQVIPPSIRTPVERVSVDTSAASPKEVTLYV